MTAVVDAIDWGVAVKVARRLSGSEPFASSYHAASLNEDFRRFTTEAEGLVAEETGLRSLTGSARGRVVTRHEWVLANMRTFRRMLRPITERLGERLGGPLGPPARAAAGAEIGALLGWMSKRVLGQYDLLLASDDGGPSDPNDPLGSPEGDGDVVSYVGPNVLALEKRYAFAPDEFRLWLSLHEVTHRAQFTGVPWMRGYYLSLIDTTLSMAEPDPAQFVRALRRAAQQVMAGHNPLDDGGIVALFASPAQKVALDQVGGLMSLLEGHGDITMNRAGLGRVPSADRFHATLTQRRAEVKGTAKFVRQALGLEAKMAQYAQGERFVEAVEKTRGQAFLSSVWSAPERLPTLMEIRTPALWIARMDRLSPAPASVA